ncbi:GyrI-like domain-containing protein [uncultured Flavobacterium sp.]|uniref:GyrI-like domain-containing protein n=1 Tax=uncultured Flavobacterium sp. TaxID=165435 RepID=UPI0025EB8695|nr:GyrI-like domain-containing protein [uncultured Flavobacterium sp.]
MKIVKYVFLLLLLSLIAVTVFIATQDGKYDITKQSVIKVPKAVLYNYISDYRNWENVGIISDSTAAYSYSETSYGKGASMAWKNTDTEGKINTIRLTDNDSIIQKATIDGLDSQIRWNFKDTVGGTKITVRMVGQLGFSEKAYAVLKGHGSDKMEAVLGQGLKNLATFLVDELAKFNVEVKEQVTKTGVFYIGQAVSSKTSDVQKKAGEIFPKLMAFIKTNKIATNGAPFLLYKSFNTQHDSTAFMVCVPIKEEMYTAPGSEFEGNRLMTFQALKTTLKGDYSHLPKAWAAARKHIAASGMQENTTGEYVELFTKGMAQTKRPSEWVTDLYIPVGAPAIPLPIDILLTPEGVPAPSSSPERAQSRPMGTAGSTVPNPARPAANRATPTGTSRPAATKPQQQQPPTP